MNLPELQLQASWQRASRWVSVATGRLWLAESGSGDFASCSGQVSRVLFYSFTGS